MDKYGISLAPCLGIRIPGTGFQSVELAWIPDSNCLWDSGFLELYSGFQNPGFWIPQAKFFPDSGIRIPLHGATSTKNVLADSRF